MVVVGRNGFVKVDMLVEIDFIPQYPPAYAELPPSFYRASGVQMQSRTEQYLSQRSQIDFLRLTRATRDARYPLCHTRCSTAAPLNSCSKRDTRSAARNRHCMKS